MFEKKTEERLKILNQALEALENSFATEEDRIINLAKFLYGRFSTDFDPSWEELGEDLNGWNGYILAAKTIIKNICKK